MKVKIFLIMRAYNEGVRLAIDASRLREGEAINALADGCIGIESIDALFDDIHGLRWIPRAKDTITVYTFQRQQGREWNEEQREGRKRGEVGRGKRGEVGR